jgi:hypothetical protein
VSQHIRGTRNALAAISFGLLSACSSVSQVKDVASDRDGYLTANFSPQSLSSSIAAKVPSDLKGSRFGRLIIKTEASGELSDGRKESWKAVWTLVDVGNGLVERIMEASNNDIPYLLNYSLAYRGYVELKWQSVPLRVTRTGPMYEIKDLTKFDAFPSAVDKEFVVDYTSGALNQIANFVTAEKSCRTTRTMAAADLHKNLHGQAVEFECRLSVNNALQVNEKFVMLEDYGVTILLESSKSAQKTTFRIVDVGS